MKFILSLVVVWLALTVAYLFSTGDLKLPALPEPAPPTPVAAVITWEQEFADLCRSARRVRDEIRSNELGRALAVSRCADLVGRDGWQEFAATPVEPSPVVAPVAPLPPQAVPTVEPRSVPRPNAEPHMTDTCTRMREKLNDETLNDAQWFSLRDSYNGLCQ